MIITREYVSFLIEKAFEKLGNDPAGKIAEHSMLYHLHHHISKTSKDPAIRRRSAVAKVFHQKMIKKLGKGANPEDVAIRELHGEGMAQAAIKHYQKEGRGASITRAGHTSKKGDISKFTNGVHKDGQENPSDGAVEMKKNKKVSYGGISCKSSKRSSKITTKGPSIDFYDRKTKTRLLDTEKRKLDTRAISREALDEANRQTSKDIGVEHSTKAAARGRIIDQYRKKEKVKTGSSVERIANRNALGTKKPVVDELHAHMKHLLTNEGEEGHHRVRQLLKLHLIPKTSMPWIKTSAKGTNRDNLRVTVTSKSNSKLNKILNNKASRFAVTKTNSRVTVHHVTEVNGKRVLTPIAHYSPKPNSNAYKNNTHQWSVTPGNIA